MKTRFRAIMIGALLVTGGILATAQGGFQRGVGGNFPFVDKQDLFLPGQTAGHATLLLGKSAVTNRERFSVEYRFVNTGLRCGFYNPFLERGTPIPAELVIYDSDREYVGNLLQGGNGGALNRGRLASDTIWIPAGSSVGSQFGTCIPGLAPGDYYLQIVFLQSFVWTSSGTNALFRSNPVRITVRK
jgi:hypothetical protein